MNPDNFDLLPSFPSSSVPGISKSLPPVVDVVAPVDELFDVGVTKEVWILVALVAVPL